MNLKNILTAAVIAASVLTSLAHAHAKIEVSEPKAGSELKAAPKEIRLKFNEKLEPAFSKIDLIDAKGVKIPLPKAIFDTADPAVMFTTVPQLSSGSYRIRWSTMTRDGHKMNGEIPFLVK